MHNAGGRIETLLNQNPQQSNIPSGRLGWPRADSQDDDEASEGAEETRPSVARLGFMRQAETLICRFLKSLAASGTGVIEENDSRLGG